MKLTANTQLTGTAYAVAAGETFEVDDDTGRDLIASGMARRHESPRVMYQTKVVVPEAPEVGGRQGDRRTRVKEYAK